jgi:hypothetical protein
MTMFARWLARAAVPAIAVAVTLSAMLAPTQAASSARWRVARFFADPGQEFAVSAAGSGDAWVTGVTGPYRLDVERWNGRNWQRIAPPAHLGRVSLDNLLAPVGSSSTGNAWVFPTVDQGTRPESFALHWNNGRWTSSRLPSGTTIDDTAGFSADNAWAFGLVGSGSHTTPYDVRYQGHLWRRMRLPGAPDEVSALSADNMWAVGPSAATVAKPSSKQITLVMHWNGHTWSAVHAPVPALRPGGGLDDAIAATGADSLWLAYIDLDRNGIFVSNGMLHWDGARWHRLKLPAHFTYYLNSMTQDGRGGVFICSPDGIYHYNAGHWTRQQLPGPNPSQIGLNTLAWIPGTASALAVGERSFHGLILKYGT